MIKIWIYQEIYMLPWLVLSEVLKLKGLEWMCIPTEELGKILSYIFVIKKMTKRFRKVEEFQFKVKYKPSAKEWIFVMIAVIAYIFAYDNSIGLLINLIPENEWFKQAFKELGQQPFLIQLIAMCVTAPIFEEMIIRGIILERLNKRCGAIKAILISSLFFGIMHWNIHQGVDAFFAGLLMGYVYVKTDSLILTIAMHFANNLYCLIADYVPYLENFETKAGFVGAIVGAVVLFMICRYFSKSKSYSKESNIKLDF